VSVAAFDAAGDPDRYPEAGEPWQPLKLYYHMSFTRARFEALHAAMTEAGMGSPYGDWISRWEDRPQKWEVTTRVPCGDYFEARDQALIAHATQVDPDGFWFVCPRDVQQKVWPTEDYHLARSLVDPELPEDDLFAGIHAGVSPARP
jgi:mycothiol S-conjugate amidase